MKKNPKGGGNIRKRSDGRWEGRAFLGYDPLTGKPKRKSIYAKTQEEVRKKLNAIIGAVDNGLYVEPTKLTVSEWLEVWINEYTAHLKPRTVEEYAKSIKNNIVPYIGNIKIAALTETAVQAHMNKLSHEGLSAKTVKNIHGVLHSALSEAVHIGYISRNPATGSKLPRSKKNNFNALSLEDTAKVIEAFNSHKYGRVYLTYLLTGLRRSELLGLTWDCIDFKNARIRVYKQWLRVNHTHSIQPLKNNKQRVIAATPALIEILKTERAVQAERRFKAGKLWNDENFVFTDEIGMPLSDSTVYNNFKRLVNNLGLPMLRLHDLRHAYAINALRAHDNIKAVSEHLGHFSVAFTLDIYADYTEDMKDQSAANMQSFLDGLKVLK